jgi:hypothetical protein
MAQTDINALVGDMTPEQKILVSSFFSFFNSNAAAHRQVLDIQPFVLSNGAAELFVYSATKMYICLSCIAGYSTTSDFLGYMILRDYANNVQIVYLNSNSYYKTDTLTPKFINNTIEIRNIWFSCMTSGVYDNFFFIGYRVTLN